MTTREAPHRLYPFSDVWIAYCARTTNLLALNETGRFIWETHLRSANREDTAAALSRAYGVSPIQARQDVDGVLDAWQELSESPAQALVDHPMASRAPDAKATASAGDAEVHHYRLSGRVFAIRFGDRCLAGELKAIIGHLQLRWDAAPDKHMGLQRTKNGYEVELDGHCFVSETLDGAIERLLFEMVEAAYRSRELQAVLHAGAVLDGEHAIVFAGARGSGKSTLVAALVAAGLGYLSDDVCPLDATTGRLIPIPAPQAIKPSSLEALAQSYPRFPRLPTFQRFGRNVYYLPQKTPAPATWEHTWTVKALVFPSYQAKSTPALRTLAPLERITLLARSGSILGTDDIGGFLAFVESTPGFSITYADLTQALDLLRQAFGQLKSNPSL